MDGHALNLNGKYISFIIIIIFFNITMMLNIESIY